MNEKTDPLWFPLIGAGLGRLLTDNVPEPRATGAAEASAVRVEHHDVTPTRWSKTATRATSSNTRTMRRDGYGDGRAPVLLERHKAARERPAVP